MISRRPRGNYFARYEKAYYAEHPDQAPPVPEKKKPKKERNPKAYRSYRDRAYIRLAKASGVTAKNDDELVRKGVAIYRRVRAYNRHKARGG